MRYWLHHDGWQPARSHSLKTRRYLHKALCRALTLNVFGAHMHSREVITQGVHQLLPFLQGTFVHIFFPLLTFARFEPAQFPAGTQRYSVNAA